jgi:crotonobetainyl-CoA:carnitine CoA-transferase CaiB-like acyl-CoA transferase
MLSQYRVIDLSDERGQLCGQILGDLGADVILVEPPSGSRARFRGPYYNCEARPDFSLPFWAYNRNKRSVTLGFERSDDDLRKLLDLIASADFLIESSTPGYLEQYGLEYAKLSALNPRLIYVSISGFGQIGPKASYAESDLTIVAAGGPLILQGDEDRAPVRIVEPQAYLHASADAAAAALIAHHERVRSGRGQHIDVSAQQSVAIAAFSQPLVPSLGATPSRRMSGGARVGNVIARQVWPAKDGFVVLVLWFGRAIGPATKRLIQCIFDHGMCDQTVLDTDWMNYDARLLSGEVSQVEYEGLKRIVERFTRSLKKDELFKLALENALLIAPVATISEVAKSPQLLARDYWRWLEHSEIGAAISYPGPFARFSETPITYRRRPPGIGEHNHEILVDDARSMPASRPSLTSVTSSQKPLEGLKVVDLFWAMAGPASTRALADYGATVVRIESSRRLDTCRTIGPYVNDKPGIETSGIFINLNAGKLGITLDLGREEGREVFRDLVRWGDVVTESFSPKAMRSWGLNYEALRSIKPEIIMVSSCLMGQTGPFAQFAGYGNLAAAMCGFGNLCGWPDRPPAGPYGSYTDCVAPRFTIVSILAALEYRRRTGRGQYIEISQAEASMHFLTPALLDFNCNGYVLTPTGNRDPRIAPQGIYQCSGEDSWIAIACATDQQWVLLSEVIGHKDLTANSRQFADLSGRLKNHDLLDSIISSWTEQFDAFAIESMLQARGIPASKVAASTDLQRDLQLRAREHWVEVEDPRLGKIVIERSAYTLSRTPGKVERSAPVLGADNTYVLENMLGYSRSRIDQLTSIGVLQ